MKTYKVRITDLPMDYMAYGGQSSYALDVGRRGVYTAQSESPFNFENSTLEPIDREDANIEAEKDEYAVGDFTGDGILRNFKIGGKRHSEGGTPLNVPEGTFIYSDTRKMKIKDPNILSYFNMPSKKGGYTPAEIAGKQYGNLNKFTAYLEDPNRDPLAKKTAGIMRNEYLKKLGMLAFQQESMKNFPQGIPDVAMPYLPDEIISSIQGQQQEGFESPDQEEQQEQMMMPEAMYGMGMRMGGLAKYQGSTGGSQYPRRKVSKSEIPGFESQGYKKVPDLTNVWRRVDQRDKEKGAPGAPETSTEGSWRYGRTLSGKGNFTAPKGCENLLFTPEDMKARPRCYNTFLEKEGWKDATPEEQKDALLRLKRGKRSIYTPGVVTPGTPGKPDYCPEGYKFNDATGKCEKIDEITYDEPATTTTTTLPPPPGKRPRAAGLSFDYTIPPKIYFPDYAPIEGNIPEPTFYDPTRELAEQAANRSMMANYASRLGPQAFSGRANALQAQGAEQAANTMGRYQNLNVGVANQFSPLQSQIANTLSGLRSDRSDKLMIGNVVAKQQYDNAQREYLDRYRTINEFRKKENMMRNLTNASNPYFNVDAAGNVIMRPQVGQSSYEYITGQRGSSPAGGSSSGYGEFEQEIKRLKDLGYDAATIKLLLERNPKFASMSGGSSRATPTRSMADYANDYMSAMGGSSNTYPFS